MVQRSVKQGLNEHKHALGPKIQVCPSLYLYNRQYHVMMCLLLGILASWNLNSLHLLWDDFEILDFHLHRRATKILGNTDSVAVWHAKIFKLVRRTCKLHKNSMYKYKIPSQIWQATSWGKVEQLVEWFKSYVWHANMFIYTIVEHVTVFIFWLLGFFQRKTILNLLYIINVRVHV